MEQIEQRPMPWIKSNVRILTIMTLVVVGIPAGTWYYLREKEKERQSDQFYKELFDSVISSTISRHIKAGLSRSAPTRSLHLTNADVPSEDKKGETYQAEELAQCELSFTITFDSGDKETVHKYWERWKRNETKQVAFPNRGRVQRVEVKGQVVDGEGKVVKLSHYYSFSEC